MVRSLYALTLFVSATLLFIVQPMVAKMILPLLGGTPAVWITCMLFFQAALLAGYLYAHVTPAWLGTRRQAALHLALLLGPVLVLPLLRLPLNLLRGEAPVFGATAFTLLGGVPSTAHPTGWLLGLLAICVGLPFLAVATSAPLLQKWFTDTGHPDARDPYFLYGASNLGSMLALLGYPSIVEPTLRMTTQTFLWAAGYGVLLVLTALCAVVLWRSPPGAAPSADSRSRSRVAGEAIGWADRLRWVALAFVPSGLLLGVTTYLSTDIAAIPLLWVVPLALYLLTFILAFARRPLIPARWVIRALPILVLLQLFAIIRRGLPISGAMVLHLATFFVAALLCHGELARRRPSARHLTEFYLWMSIGGALGGLFSAVVAPLVFTSVAEYPLEMGLACLVGPAVISARPRRTGPLLNLGLPLVAGAFAGAMMVTIQTEATPSQAKGVATLLSVLAVGLPVICYVALVSFTQRPLLFGLGVAGLMLAGVTTADVSGQVLYRERTFFGILRVAYVWKDDVTSLYHGSTLHGQEFCSPEARSAGDCDPSRRDEPLTYYHHDGPIGQVFEALAGRKSMGRVAVVGLGAGSLASYGVSGQEMVFYEIDPAVQRIACDLGYFSFMGDSAARVRVVIGDGRLSLRSAANGGYGLIILDAFSSDSVPVHLLTREALVLYVRKLARDGVLAFHVSNRYLDLRPVLGDLARDAGLECRARKEDIPDETGWPPEKKTHRTPTTWVVIARDKDAFGSVAGDQRWVSIGGRPDRAVWTDDFSNLLRAFK